MRMLSSIPVKARQVLRRIQDELEFQSWSHYRQFNTSTGLGRVGLIGCALGISWGMHGLAFLVLLLHQLGIVRWNELEDQLGQPRLQLLLQYCAYVVIVCSFHLAEFFTTALCNPTVLTANAYIISQSPAYTLAAFLAFTECWIRLIFFPSVNSVTIMWIGLAVLMPAQVIRTLAMVTAGESFNHLIQTKKKDNHVLITNGIYAYLRHPSYFGFYFWSVGTQLLLCNPVNTILFAYASRRFFQIRIPYEEESLMHHFPEEYAAYAARTWVGIPFVRSGVELLQTQ